ncbi:MAG: hypothetical protein F7B59_03775 [Desulfurococcales archaeon]|nr:hypothetical protein [Desulfurococcales archaeon]
MNGKKQTIILIFTLGLLIGLLGGYNFGYIQGEQYGKSSVQSKLSEIENNYKMLLLIEKLSSIEKLETIAMKQTMNITQKSAFNKNLTRDITIEASAQALEASNLVNSINCPEKTENTLKMKIGTLESLTEKMTLYLDNQDYQDMVNTYREIMITINDIAEIINTC